MSTDKRRFGSPKEAREQAAEAQGFLASIEIKAGDETFEISQRGLLDDDQAERLAEVELETETWDRNDPTTLDNGTVLPGTLKRPYRKNGKLIKPQYPVRVAVAVLGEDGYKRYNAAGGRAADVTAALAMLDQRLEEREAADSKSVVGNTEDQVVSDAD